MTVNEKMPAAAVKLHRPAAGGLPQPSELAVAGLGALKWLVSIHTS